MPNQERPNIGALVEAADAGTLTVSKETKDKITSTEAEIRGLVSKYKSLGIYGKVSGEFSQKQEAGPVPQDKVTPEFLLLNMGVRFEKMRADVSSSKAEMLRALADDTLADLTAMKTDLEYTGYLLEREATADRVLKEQTAIREQETASAIEQEVVRGFLEQIQGENTALNSKIKTVRESSQGLDGYLHAIEPSNLVASLGGAFTEGGLETKEMVQLKLYTDYQATQLSAERGLLVLVKAMRGSEKNNLAPKSLTEAWAGLQRSGNPDFSTFRGSPEGHLFERTVIQGGAPTELDQAQYYYEKGMELRGRIGAEEAEPYLQMVIHEFPETTFASEAQKNAMTSGEKAYQKFTQVGDIFLRLDMLAVMAAAPAAGLVAGQAVAKLPQAARVAKLIEAYPRLSKIVPGVKVLKAAETAGRLEKGALAFGNFTIEVGKFTGAVATAEKIGGPEAAYFTGMLCFFTPGLVHGFEKTIGGTVEHGLAKEGPGLLKRMGAYISERTGGVEGLKQLLVRGLEGQAFAMGVAPSAQLIRTQVSAALRVVGLELETVAVKARAEASHVAKEAVEHSVDHTVKHKAAHGGEHAEEGAHAAASGH